MASSRTQLQYRDSLPSGSSSWKYDVFLSFRGEDTRKGFVDHLDSALHQKGIFTFKDDRRLERGESISPALLKAIEESRFAVVVFSEGYASSKWCLEELVKILECQKTRGLTVLPVFYKVDPSDVRKQRGRVGEAFARHEQDSSEEKEKQKVQRWMNALMEAANISGWDSETHGPEATLVRNLALHILSRLGDIGSSVLEDVVGLHSRVAKVMSLLELRLDLDVPRMVGICGMGGIGKTTIARAIFDQIHSQFDASSYLANVREIFSANGVMSLQKSLLSEILLDDDVKVKNCHQGLSMIMNRVRHKRVLVVLDDVNHSDQLDFLVGRLDQFGSGSRIIITTRDSHLLAKYEEKKSIYDVDGLNDEEALELFCCNAFGKNRPTKGYEELANSIVHYARGVPLALRVLGSLLFGRSIIEWRSAIDRLRQQPNPKIQEVLKLSYEGLENEEKEIFLDIACFFKSASKDYVIDILNACGFHADIGVRVLEDKALVTIRDNMIDMHDLIQEMGLYIVYEESPKEPGRRSRLWNSEDIYRTLTKKTGTEMMEAIFYYPLQTKKMSLSPDTFSKMSKLRLLMLHNVQLPKGLNYLSSDLRLLDWCGYPSKYLPSNFQLDNLVTLKMSWSGLKQPWNERMCLDKLKDVDLSHSPYIAKNLDFTHAANLEKLNLEGCRNLVELPSIGAIKRLTLLNLRGLKHLKVLPTGCWLKSVEQLVLSGCSKLKNVSEVLTFTKCLIRLYLDGTRVKELPVEHLSSLQFISLRNCKELTSLPSGICGLKLLASLIVSGCSKLSKLPENLGGLERLQELHADFTAIKQPPPSIRHLKELRVLSFRGCKGPITSTPWDSLFSSLLIRKKPQDPMGFEPPPLSSLSSLFALDLRDCNLSEGFLLNDLGSLSSLQKLCLRGTNITSLPASIRGLDLLVSLELRDCKKLKTLPYLPLNIYSIGASGCISLETFPIPAVLPRRLQNVCLINCHTLVKNQPGLPRELLRRSLKGFGAFRNTIVVPETQIPEEFMYQNNMEPYVRIRLMPDWYQKLRGFVVCAIFEAKASPIDAEVRVGCYGMCNDEVVYTRSIVIEGFQFQCDHLFLDCMALEEGTSDLKTCTEIIFYSTISSLKMFAVRMEYENDEGVGLRKKNHRDYDGKADTGERSNLKTPRDVAGQRRDSQSELSGTLIQNLQDSAIEKGISGFYLIPDYESIWPVWSDGKIETVI